jgi:hypothetical protein
MKCYNSRYFIGISPNGFNAYFLLRPINRFTTEIKCKSPSKKLSWYKIVAAFYDKFTVQGWEGQKVKYVMKITLRDIA